MTADSTFANFLLSPVDVATLVHAAAGRNFRGPPIAIAMVPVDIVGAVRLANRAMLLHFVSRTKARCARPPIVSVPTTLHLVTGAEMRGSMRAAPAAIHAALRVRE